MDVLVGRSDGTAGSPVIVQTGQSYTGIAASGSNGFIAIGPKPDGTGTDVTVG